MQLYEYYNLSDPALASLWGSFWQGQTFTPRVNHTIKKVKLNMYRHESPGIIDVEIQGTDVDGLPDGIVKCFGETDGDTLPEVYRGEWREITLGDGAALDMDTKYAIVVKAVGGDVDNYVRWLFQRPSTYPTGAHVFSSNAGNEWEEDTTRDMKFEEWGEPV